ncbi:MAG: DASH family cryptochrome [Pyrinomonadaceae bacterium]|nr:DASH family cryptochrome [Sphingobacteriaceae bacterium]
MNGKTILVWFRNDLRVHDNEILLEAVKRADLIVPVFCFDPRYFSTTNYGTKKTGEFRAKFLLESVVGLRLSLQGLGGDLMIKFGLPEEILPQICQQYSISEVYHHREVAAEETDISGYVEAALWKQQINLKHFIGHTLYHKEDLPFPIRDIPDVFNIFRKKVERDSNVRTVFETPNKITVPLNMETGELPGFEAMQLSPPQLDERAQYRFIGGEQEGLLRLASFLKTAPTGKNIKSVSSISSLLSPWLSVGCLSPRVVYWQAKMVEREHAISDFIARIVIELQWRDYFRFMLKKHGSKITHIKTEELTISQRDAYESWKNGNTGVAIVDACMAELNSTGYINNICRQYTASYLVKDLGISWQAGAAYFEEKLLDYSPASNWGNWTHLASEGVLSVNRTMSIKEEPFLEEQYIKKWLVKANKVI